MSSAPHPELSIFAFCLPSVSAVGWRGRQCMRRGRAAVGVLRYMDDFLMAISAMEDERGDCRSLLPGPVGIDRSIQDSTAIADNRCRLLTYNGLLGWLRMAYSLDVRVAARRHYRAAEVLYGQNAGGDQPRCKAVAGYLFGIAGELAVKELMRASGMRPLPETERRDDPFFAHFPTLKRMLATAHGRRSGELRRISENPRLFQNWDTSMRYAPDKDIRLAWVDEWKEAAGGLIGQMDTI